MTTGSASFSWPSATSVFGCEQRQTSDVDHVPDFCKYEQLPRVRSRTASASALVRMRALEWLWPGHCGRCDSSIVVDSSSRSSARSVRLLPRRSVSPIPPGYSPIRQRLLVVVFFTHKRPLSTRTTRTNLTICLYACDRRALRSRTPVVFRSYPAGSNSTPRPPLLSFRPHFYPRVSPGTRLRVRNAPSWTYQGGSDGKRTILRWMSKDEPGENHRTSWSRGRSAFNV
ncbi:hypothetical protein C8T65DRAFT_18651 [Cerioporus squamosus]|nr:hypothetical protein C8T65DRAFT_18651 [Cerioporus squamosus]